MRFLFLFFVLIPFPVTNFRQILAVFINIYLMFDELILHHLFQIGPFSAQMRQSVNNVLHQVEPVKFVFYPDVERRGNRSFFYISPDMYIPVSSAVCQPVNQPWISMESKNYVFVFCEE